MLTTKGLLAWLALAIVFLLPSKQANAQNCNFTSVAVLAAPVCSGSPADIIVTTQGADLTGPATIRYSLHLQGAPASQTYEAAVNFNGPIPNPMTGIPEYVTLFPTTTLNTAGPYLVTIIKITADVTGGTCSETFSPGDKVGPLLVVGPPVASINGAATVAVGATTSFNLIGDPGGVWSVTGSAATVTSSGNVTGLSAGTTNIVYTITTPCGTASSTQAITVTAAAANAGSISATQTTICPGATAQFSSNGDAGGTWSSQAPGIATVNASTGLVTGVSPGTTNIVYTVTTMSGSASNTLSVSVGAAMITSAASAAPSLCLGESMTSISHTTTGATGITNAGVAGANGLPAGVAASFAGNIITISGMPTAAGTFNYSIPLTGGCGSVNATGTIKVNSVSAIAINMPESATTICSGTSVTLTGYALDAGVEAKWQKSIDNGSSWTDVATTKDYTDIVSQTTKYRKVATSGDCSGVSNILTVTVNRVNAGTIAGAQTLCSGGSAVLTGNAAGSGITYQWEKNTNGSWTAIAGATNKDFTEAAVTTTTSYRRLDYQILNYLRCSATSNLVTVTVVPQPVVAGVEFGRSSMCTGETTRAFAMGVLPAGSSGVWSSRDPSIVSIDANTGLMTGVSAGITTINYTVTSACGDVAVNGRAFIVSGPNTVTSSTNPVVCVNTFFGDNAPSGYIRAAAITHTTTGATGIGSPTGLPPDMNASWSNNVISITGFATTEGVYNYRIALVGGCGKIDATGTITVRGIPTAIQSTAAIVCKGAVMVPILHTTTGATSIGAPTGLPAGITASFTNNAITISGTPATAGTFTYTIPLIGCGVGSVTGTITVKNTVGFSSSRYAREEPYCANVPVYNGKPYEVYDVTGATGFTISGGSLPPGVTANLSFNQIILQGLATQPGTYTYTLTATGDCGSASLTDSLVIGSQPIVSAASSTPTVCVGSPITPITHTTTGASGIKSASNLPPGLKAVFENNSVVIRGTPENDYSSDGPETYKYSILLKGCGNPIATGTILVTYAPVPVVIRIDQPSCLEKGKVVVNGLKGSLGTKEIINYTLGGIWTVQGAINPVLGTYYGQYATFENLPAGTYSLTASIGSCVAAANTVVTIVDPMPPPSFSATLPTCALPAGTVTATAKGAVIYTLGTISNTTGVFQNLSPGTYTLTAGNGSCTSAPVTVTLNLPSAGVATPTFTAANPSCTVLGSVFAKTPKGATFTLGGTWTSTGIFANIPAGTYSLTASVGSCTSAPVSVIMPTASESLPIPTFTITQPVCPLTTGSLRASSEFKNAGFTIIGNKLIGGSLTSAAEFTNLPLGTYTLLTGTGSCTSGGVTVTIERVPHNYVITQPACGVTGGSLSMTTANPDAFFRLFDKNSASVAQAEEGLFLNLQPGSYTLTVSSTGGCHDVNLPVVINPPTANLDVPTFTVKQPDCDNSDGSVKITSAIEGLEFRLGLYTSTKGQFQNIPAGVYSLTASNGSCSSAPITVEIKPYQPSQLVHNIFGETRDAVDLPQADGAIHWLILGGPGTATLWMQGGKAIRVIKDHIAKFENLSAGTYTFTLDDDNGCSLTRNLTVPVAPPRGRLVVTASINNYNTAIHSKTTAVRDVHIDVEVKNESKDPVSDVELDFSSPRLSVNVMPSGHNRPVVFTTSMYGDLVQLHPSIKTRIQLRKPVAAGATVKFQIAVWLQFGVIRRNNKYFSDTEETTITVRAISPLSPDPTALNSILITIPK